MALSVVSERRNFTRIPFDASVTLSNRHGTWYAKLLDISLKGLLISKPVHWPVETNMPFLVEVHQPESLFTIRMETNVAHSSDESIGLQCTHVDFDSIAHVRRLVELNLGDDELLHRELRELIA